MTDLVCAACARPVAEGRCPTCRASRQHLASSSSWLTPEVLILLIAVLAALSVLATHVGR